MVPSSRLLKIQNAGDHRNVCKSLGLVDEVPALHVRGSQSKPSLTTVILINLGNRTIEVTVFEINFLNSKNGTMRKYSSLI